MPELPGTPPVCNYEGSDYQTSFWERGGRAYEDAVESVALKRLLPTAGKLLLELGAGAGRNTPRYQGYDRVVLLDYSCTQLQQAQQRLGQQPRYTFVAADILRNSSRHLNPSSVPSASGGRPKSSMTTLG